MTEGDTLPKLFVRNCQKWPNNVAMQKKTLGIWKQYAWGQCYQKVKHLSLGLISLGLEPGDKVAILGDSEPAWYWGQLACQAANAAVVGLFTDAIASEIKYILNHSDSKFIIVKDQEQVDKVLSIKEELPLIRKVVYWDPAGLWSYDDPILTSFNAVLELGKEYEQTHPNLFEENVAQGKTEDIALLCYTSGTTGLPKGTIIPYRGFMGTVKGLLSIIQVTENDDQFSLFPGAWIGEQLWGMGLHCITGVRISFAEEPETVQQNLREISPKIFPAGPRQWESLVSTVQVKINRAGLLKRLAYRLLLPVGYKIVELSSKGKQPNVVWKVFGFLADWALFRPVRDRLGIGSRTKYPMTGSSASSPDIFRYLHALGIRLRNSYATTEGGGFHTVHRDDDVQIETVGQPIPGMKIRISDGGEILIGGSSVSLGYYKDPELTQKNFEGGWFHTGDAGFFTEGGHLIFLDRVSELGELSSGHKYSPTYIEGKVKFSPYIKDAIVIGGKERAYVSAIMNIDFENVARWAESRGITYTTFVDLSQKPQVYDLVERDIERVNKVLPEQSKVRKYVLLHKEFDPDEAELTRTRKLRRHFFEEKYQDLIGAIYQDKEGIEVQAAVRYRDGRTGTVSTSLKIKSVR